MKPCGIFLRLFPTTPNCSNVSLPPSIPVVGPMVCVCVLNPVDRNQRSGRVRKDCVEAQRWRRGCAPPLAADVGTDTHRTWLRLALREALVLILQRLDLALQGGVVRLSRALRLEESPVPFPICGARLGRRCALVLRRAGPARQTWLLRGKLRPANLGRLRAARDGGCDKSA